jgi:hypothetical protein
MRIDVRCRVEMDGASLRDEAERRVRVALGRFERRVRRVDVRFVDVNGPKGGPDHECRIELRLSAPRRLILVEEADAEPRAALARATDRAARIAARTIAQAHDDWQGGARRGAPPLRYEPRP